MAKQQSDYTKVAPEVRISTLDWWRQYFPNNNNAATWAIEEVPHLVRHTLAELRGYFTAGELWMMVDVMNGHAMNQFGQWATAGRHINISIQDSFELYPGMYEKKWGVEKEIMIDKLLALTRWQCACLEIWISGFWQRNDAGQSPEPDKYIADMSGTEGS